MRVGFIGVGQMGAPMARRLIDAGHSLRIFDVNADSRAAFGELAVSSPREAGRGAEVVITMLPHGEIVREVLTGEAGALADADEGVVALDTSSSDAIATRMLASELSARGVMLIDAPVSGGMGAVAAGKLTIMVGSESPAALSRVRPLLEALSSRLIEVGPSGAGHAAKALNNVIAATILAVTSEGVLAASRFGIAPNVMLDLLNASTGRSGVSETIFLSQILPRTFNVGFATGLMAKDTGIAANLARILEADTPLIDLAASQWAKAAQCLGSGSDFSNYLCFVEQCNGGAAISNLED